MSDTRANVLVVSLQCPHGVNFELGFAQLLEWAHAYVWGETCIPESAEADLTPSEREGLKLLRFMLGADHGL